jgi:hypothetical protein
LKQRTGTDWDEIIERNAERLVAVLTELFVMSPLRPGFAPGFHRTNTKEIDAILSDCHYFAREAWDRPDTS